MLCGHDGICPVIVPGTQELFVVDYGHWTVDGAAYFGRALLHDQPNLKKLLFGSPAKRCFDEVGARPIATAFSQCSAESL